MKNQKVRIQWLWQWHISRFKNENRSLKDLPQADFGRLPGWFLLSIRTNSITENFVYWKLGPLFVFVAIQRMFSFRVSQHTLRFVVGDGRSFYFHSLIELIFLVIKRLLCLYDKQNNTWLLVNMKFLLSCSTRREIPYVRALMCYSLFNCQKIDDLFFLFGKCSQFPNAHGNQ